MMDNKKKKYRKKEERQAQTPRSSTIMVNDWQDCTPEEVQLDFDFPSKSILHLWLRGTLPGAVYLNLTFKFNQKKIIGVRSICEDKIYECEEFIKSKKMKSIISNTKIQRNTQMFLHKRYSCLFFDREAIERAHGHILKFYKFKECENDIRNLLKNPHPYLVSVDKSCEDNFLQYYEFFASEGLEPTRKDIEVADKDEREFSFYERMRKKIGRGPQKNMISEKAAEQASDSAEDDDEQQQSSEDPEVNFYNVGNTPKPPSGVKAALVQQPQKESQVEKLVDSEPKKKKKWVQKEAKLDHKESMPQLKYQQDGLQQGRRVVGKKTLMRKTFDNKDFDLDAFKFWLKRNQVLQDEDFEFIRRPDQTEVALVVRGNDDQKLQQANIYFKFQKCLILNQNNKTQVEAVRKEFCRPDYNESVSIELKEGFMEPGTKEHKLRRLIVDNKINRGGGRNTERFAAVWMVGLKPVVERQLKKIEQFIDDLPEEDKQFTIDFELGDLKHYISDARVEELVRKCIIDELSKEAYITTIDVKTKFRSVYADIEVKFDCVEQFSKDQKRLEMLLTNLVVCHEIIDDKNDITPEMQEKNILLPSAENLGKGVLVAAYRDITLKTKQIITEINKNKTTIMTKQIVYKRGRWPVMCRFFTFLKNDPNSKQIMANITYRPIEAQNKVEIVGHGGDVSKIYALVEENLARANDTLKQRSFFISDQQANILEKRLQDYIAEVGHPFELIRNINIGAIVTMGEETKVSLDAKLVIYFERNKSLLQLPKNTLIFFNSSDEIKAEDKFLIPLKAQLQNRINSPFYTEIDKQNQYQYAYYGPKDYKLIVESVSKQYMFKNVGNIRRFCFMMPKDPRNAKLLVDALIEIFQSQMAKGQICVYIIFEGNLDLEKTLSLKPEVNVGLKKIKTYYVEEKGLKLMYAPSGNKKITDALFRMEKVVYLTNEDLYLTQATHKCSLAHKKITHLQSSIETPIQVRPNSISFTIKGITFELPSEEQKKVRTQTALGNQEVEISVGAYLINLDTMIQVNLFSDFKRDVKCLQEEVKSKYKANLNVSYDYKVNQVEFIFEENEREKVEKAINKLKMKLEDEKIFEVYKLENKLSADQTKDLENAGIENNVNIFFKGDTDMLMSSFDEISLRNFKKIIPYLVSSSSEIKYPDTWEPQTQDIQTFTVRPNTPQFAQVQNSFKEVGNIKELIRIQNKLLYKKFIDEKNCLIQLNGGKDVKQMKLYHGTKSTAPEIIYEDKEESFNINYTSEYNYMGKGTYFAQRPKYSHNYRYTYQNQGIGIGFFGVGAPTYAMFYCDVLVGTSQSIPIIDGNSQAMKDTDFRDKVNKIRYESSTTYTNNSTIYAVYKNRRAYPTYLIKY